VTSYLSGMDENLSAAEIEVVEMEEGEESEEFWMLLGGKGSSKQRFFVLFFSLLYCGSLRKRQCK